MTAMPAVAQVGYVGLDYGRVDAGGGDADAFGVTGGASFQTGSDMRFLVDGSYFDVNDIDLQTLTATGHLVWDRMDSSWGGFLGLANSDSGGGDTTTWVAGGEYAHFFTGGTLALSAGAGHNDDADIDLWGVNGEYRIFASDNLRFDIGGTWANIDAGAGGDEDGTALGAGVEYRFANSPFSIGANYANIDFGGGADADVFGVTLRLDFGTGSLKDRDRKGNTFGPLGGFGQLLRF